MKDAHNLNRGSPHADRKYIYGTWHFGFGPTQVFLFTVKSSYSTSLVVIFI